MDNDDWFNSDQPTMSKSHYSKSSETELKNPCKIYISKMPETLSREGVMNMFKKFGKIMKSFRCNTTDKNFALIEYESELSAMDAICSLNGKPPLNLNITFGQSKEYDICTKSKSFDAVTEMLRNHNLTFKPIDNQDNFMDNDDSRNKMENGGTSDIGRSTNSQGPSQSNYQHDKRNFENNVESHNEYSNGVVQNSHPNNVRRTHNGFDHLPISEFTRRDVHIFRESYDDYAEEDEEYENGNEDQADILQDLFQHVKYISDRMKRQQSRDNIVVNASPSGRQVKIPGRDRYSASPIHAGADRTLPPLLVKHCLLCDRLARMFCMYCQTPYCSKQCQAEDWDRRHKNVCHNLAAAQLDSDNDEVPIRRPFTHNSPAENLPKNNPRQSIEKPTYGAGYSDEPDYQRRTSNLQRNGSEDGSTYQKPYVPKERPSHSFDRPNRDTPQSSGSHHRPQYDKSQHDGPQRNKPQHPYRDGQRDGERRPLNSERPPFKRNDGCFDQSRPSYGKIPSTNYSQKRETDNYNDNRNDHYKSVLTPKENVVLIPAGGDISTNALTPKKKPVVSEVPEVNHDIPPFKTQTAQSPPSTAVVERTDGRPITAQVFEHGLETPFVMMVVSSGANSVFKCYTLVNTEEYETLLEPLATACESEEVIASPESGAFVSVLYENAWYRAVYVPPEGYAMIDMGQIIPEVAEVRNMPAKFKDVKEFACEMRLSDITKLKDVEVETPYTCKLVSKSAKFVTADVYPYQSEEDLLKTYEPSQALFQIKMRKWFLAKQEDMSQEAVTKTQAEVPATIIKKSSVVEEIKDEDTNLAKAEDFVNWMELGKEGGEAEVQLMHFSSGFDVFLRLGDAASIKNHDSGVFDVATASLEAPPLPAPPKLGDAVIALFQKEPYRAVVLSADVDKNVYKVVYVDYGNEECIPLSDMSVLPKELWPCSKPILVSKLKLKGHNNPQWHHKPREPLDQYMKLLIAGNITLKCTVLENGEVTLKNTETGESVNLIADKHQQLKWKKQKASGVDVHTNPHYVPKDIADCVTDLSTETPLKVINTNFLFVPFIDVRPLNYTPDSNLARQMKEYCEDEWAGTQYVPRSDELCFIKYNGAWKRAAVAKELKFGDQKVGCSFVLLDENYENVEVTYNNVRKAIEDFIDGYPRPKVTVGIKDFYPKDPSDECVIKAAALLKSMDIIKCDSVTKDKDDPGLNIIGIPALIKELKSLNLI